ncbi:hypothetical protein [Rhodococcoides fascians]|uniref:hypothetical protein n=1 Tax=Rhodococcoides fascians TaxID=1828 RepID=UPI00148272ED|nr:MULTISPECIES: hypothetical protein [Rhodococcus]
MPNRSRAPRHAAVLVSAAVSVGAAAILVAGCTADAEAPTPVSSAAPTATTASDSTSTSSVPAPAPAAEATTPLLVPPSVIASASEPPPYEPPPDEPPYDPPPYDPTTRPQDVTYDPPPVASFDPPEPVMPPPNPIDSRGFPLGTTCGPVSCTSPDGLIFVNPEAVPNLSDRGFDLCDHTYCPPPGLQIVPDQLPSTGSSGGTPTSPR